jgi:hypothetical protein
VVTVSHSSGDGYVCLSVGILYIIHYIHIL